MTQKRQESSLTAGETLAVLTREIRVRIINCSASGCLVETSAPIDVGTVGSLRLVLGGEEFSDDVRVVRCQGIEGAGSIYQVGAEFLWTVPPHRQSLRRAMKQETLYQQATIGI